MPPKRVYKKKTVTDSIQKPIDLPEPTILGKRKTKDEVLTNTQEETALKSIHIPLPDQTPMTSTEVPIVSTSTLAEESSNMVSNIQKDQTAQPQQQVLYQDPLILETITKHTDALNDLYNSLNSLHSKAAIWENIHSSLSDLQEMKHEMKNELSKLTHPSLPVPVVNDNLTKRPPSPTYKFHQPYANPNTSLPIRRAQQPSYQYGTYTHF